MDFQEALLRNPLAEHLFSPNISDEVQRDAAQRRCQRRHSDVQQKMPAVLIDIRCDYKIDGHSQQRTVGKRNHEYAPDPEHLHHPQDPDRIARQYVFNSLQWKVSVRDRNRSVSRAQVMTFWDTCPRTPSSGECSADKYPLPDVAPAYPPAGFSCYHRSPCVNCS